MDARDADQIDRLRHEVAVLRDWQFKVADALGLTEFAEGIGWGVPSSSADPDIAAEVAKCYADTARNHDRDCPVWCDGCEQYELPSSCTRCHGSGCGPGTASGAYEPCSDCDGNGRDHSFGYSNPRDKEQDDEPDGD